MHRSSAWLLLAASLLLVPACSEDPPPPPYKDALQGKDLPASPADASREASAKDASGDHATADAEVDAGCTGDGTRACYTGAAGTKGVGPCKGGTQKCENGTWGKCEGQVVPAKETCDSQDNDCDGTSDTITQDCYSGAASTKNVGQCKAGAQLCTHGKWQACTGEVLPAPEICDNKDNDCDGKADDTVTRSCYTGAAGTQGVGLCKAGSQTCSAGAWGACVGEVIPVAETCDSKDNDCDGSTDEGATQACYTGAAQTRNVGACKDGQQSCSGGVWGACSGEVTPSAELCDNKDNDCDGATDEALNQACYSGTTGTQGVGACTAGKQNCVGGAWGSCAGEVTPAAETCDNKDNNCNGKTDEGLTKYCYSGPASTKGIGQCKEGLQLCTNGSWGTCSGEVIPMAEKCDKKDNDCNGKADDLVSTACYSGPPPTRKVGICKDGTQACINGVAGVCQGEVTPLGETCDNKDNDCNGKIDDTLIRYCYTGAASTRNVGACKDGQQSCSAGAWSSCAGQVTPTNETCDNQDNDCDGKTDEFLGRSCYTGAPGTSGVGLCKVGTQACISGGWGTCSGQVTPTAETCDNQDNDCDGKTDESVFRTCYTGPSGTADVGLCRKGAQTCTAGKWSTTCSGEALPSAELCDNKDNDCDGKTDEDIKLACYTGPAQAAGVGECKEGNQICAYGVWGSCQGSVLPTTEVCDGKDNDCDSSFDEGNLCTNGNVCHGVLGCRCAGGAACTGGSHDRCCGAAGCQNLWSSTDHCGACFTGCAQGEQCASGQCQCGSKLGTVGGGPACAAGDSCCGGSCVDLSANPSHCGSCYNKCATGMCTSGSCSGSCSTNHAPGGAASSSGGGGGTAYGAQRMNDNLGCGHNFHWVLAGSSPGSAWIQIVWSSPQVVRRLEMDTVSAYSAECGSSPAGRTVAGGTIQYWSGSSWVTVGTVSGQTNDWSFTFPTAVSTTRVRIYGVHATNVTGAKANPVIIEWKIYSC